MKYARIRLPKTDLGARAFAELAKRQRVVGLREHGEIVYQVPATALAFLDSLGLPYEILARNLSKQRESPGAR